VASAGFDGSIRLWNLDQPEVAVSTLLGWANPVLSLAFAPTGDWLASGSADGTVRLWNSRKPEDDPIVLGSHEQEAFAVSFAPDGETLASGGRDQFVRMWIVNTSRLADRVCERVWRNLTEEEWSNHVGDEIPRESTCPDLPLSVENEGPGVALVHDVASSAYYGGL
jgi:WD40 repeat protein